MPLTRKPSAAEPLASAVAPSLTAADSGERWAAVRVAAGKPDQVPLLAQALAREQDFRVREAIFTALGRIATAESADAVVPYLRSDDANLRTGAIDALRAMPAASALHLPQLLADADADVRLLSCELARDLPPVEANRLLCALLERETEKNVCASAVEVLSEIGDATALPVLQQCAARFSGDSFMAFSIKVALDRLGALRPDASE
jgi:HEAT repeat protein